MGRVNDTMASVALRVNNFMNAKDAILVSGAAAGWLLTVVLVAQLLSGNFDTRACRTDCVFALYWAAFCVTVAGLAFGAVAWRRCLDSLWAGASFAALALLLAIFLATMGIGTFG